MHPVRRAVAALATALAVAGATGCAVGPSESGPVTASGGASSTAASSASTTVSIVPSPAAVARRAGGVTPQAPRELELPNGHTMAVRAVSTSANGLLDVPSDIRAAGWWQGGSRIGDPFGSTLIAAHVDSYTQGLGPFSALLSARAGDRVVVWTRDLRQVFRVVSLRLRPRSVVIGARAYLHSPAGTRRLTLVTCAGPYVRAEGGYQNLAVVTARPVGRPTPRGRR